MINIFDSIFQRLVVNIAKKKKEIKKKSKKVNLITYLRDADKLPNLTQCQARFTPDTLNIL